MSRIQEILTKAERDGAALRMRDVQAPPVAVTAIASSTPSAAFIPPMPPPRLEPPSRTDNLEREILEEEISQQETAPRIRTLARVQLDRRLITGLSLDRTALERYRALKTRIATADLSAPLRVLLVTSAGPNEGKTFTAANLALSMGADRQRRICLVDANLRQPQLHRLFGLPEGPGLCEVASGEASLDDALITLEEHNLTLLPAGRLPAQPGDLLGTTAMRRTFDALRNEFDSVVIDAPSVLPLADVWILSPFIDKALLVVRTGVTTKPAIHEAVAALDPTKLLGLVLNDAV
jgi:capsular exopolysaccharide synthesis family protein